MQASRHSPVGDIAREQDYRRLDGAVEALNNLIFLALNSAERPEIVRMYLKLAQERVDLIGDVLRKRAAGRNILK
jgi:hypothetical protein